jgi:hypothetical protein
MRTAVLCGIAIACSSAAFAQTPDAQPPSTAAPRTITLTGCVGGGRNAQPITLANAMVVPTGQDAATTPLPVPGAASAGTTQPTGGGVGIPGTATAGVGTAGTASAGVGSAAGTGAAGTTGAVGTSGVAPAPGAGSSATIAGTAPAGSSGSSISGYRLSGADMASWIGRRVQIVGSLVPAPPGAMPAAGAAPHATFPEFRVVSVQPMTGDCPQK